MQITLELQDWTNFGAYGGPGEFLEAMDEADAGSGLPSCYDLGWHSDSAIQYNVAAEALAALAPRLDPTVRAHLAAGFGRLISENGQVDDLGMGAASEHYRISATVETTREIASHIAAVDDQELVRQLRAQPPTIFGSSAEEVEQALTIMLAQHRRIVSEAERRGVGLLGHWG